MTYPEVQKSVYANILLIEMLMLLYFQLRGLQYY